MSSMKTHDTYETPKLRFHYVDTHEIIMGERTSELTIGGTVIMDMVGTQNFQRSSSFGGYLVQSGYSFTL